MDWWLVRRYGRYDVLYQSWLTAKLKGNYRRADRLRRLFEKRNRLTIFATGRMPVEGVTVHRLKESTYQSKYGDRRLAQRLQRAGL